MRTLFRIFALVGAVLVVLSVQVLRSPDSPLVLTEVLDDWYGKQMIWSALIGVACGVVGAVVAMRRVRHRPRVPAETFLERVAGIGLLSILASTALVLLVAMWMAGTADFEPLAPSEKVKLVANSGKTLGILGSSWVACAVAYALATRAVRWGGQYAILGSGLPRAGS